MVQSAEHNHTAIDGNIAPYSDGDDEEEDEEEEASWLDDLRSSWRQHCVAVLIAVAATVLAFNYRQLSLSRIITPVQVGRELQTPTMLEDLTQERQQPQHAHLDGFQRTANVSFCGIRTTPLISELSIMDFNVPDSLIPSMIMHFQTDWGQGYDNAVSDNSDVDLNERHPEISCILQLKNSSPQKYIKGVTLYFKSPSIESMHVEHDASSVKQKPPTIHAAVLTYSGFSAKFVNLAAIPVLLYWDGRGGDDRNRRLVGEIAPFEALSTATRPGESFSVAPVHDHSLALARWVVTADEAVQYYEPKKASALTEGEVMLHKLQMLNQEFAKHYLIHSGRTWLAHFPRAFPIHHMWTAEYFGQSHNAEPIAFDDERNETKTTYTLEVVSVTPRVFRIRNFLSSAECDALVGIAIRSGLKGSTVYTGGLAKQQRDLTTRSSSNTWLARGTAVIIDDIYRRAAQVLKIDESVLQAPVENDAHAHHHPIAESLQVVRYQKGEEYTPHHDWVLPSQQHRYQPTRFATLLMYLNDDFEGGHTIFPRAVNSQFHNGIKIKPWKGEAILFYNILPDGNFDDLSQHGSEKVLSGEKVYMHTLKYAHSLCRPLSG